MLRRQDLLWRIAFLLSGKVGIWKQARELVIMSESKSTGPLILPAGKVTPRRYSLGVPASIITFPFKLNAPWTAHQRRKKTNKTHKLLSRRQQSSNWGRGLHPRHVHNTVLESQHRLTQPTQHAARESKTRYTLLYANGHSAQPDMFWRTHHTNPEPITMRVMPLCLWGV